MEFATARNRMVESQLVSRGIKDTRVLETMRKVPRHRFVEEAFVSQAYNDHPLPIGEKQTISQPYMVALMTEALELQVHLQTPADGGVVFHDEDAGHGVR